ncbi:DUF883 family protein [Sphingobium lignivorans]|uniref:ElaB/YqjD/DUF883 family membrane-anchored ribosome-binding protein n=1 Tax=Sphingobium lignivorans TaxID=2735886 RepID=A0ABR6NJF5_9SPHN|nr:DUF883 family protein [Sphingobium lignivorans]MBB5986319.1 ElaB/YqjD/DUF883 family membrane-anchored ribosome-binding protein [Sphingobium lignivorans]
MTTEKKNNRDGSGTASEVRARAMDGIDQARRKAGEVIAATREKGEAVIDDTREKTYRAAAETNRLFQEHPIAAVAAAAAAGAVLAIFIPKIAIAGKAGQTAGRAVKAAAGSKAAKAMLVGLTDTRHSTLRRVASQAASSMGKHVLTRKARTAKGKAKDGEE